MAEIIKAPTDLPSQTPSLRPGAQSKLRSIKLNADRKLLRLLIALRYGRRARRMHVIRSKFPNLRFPQDSTCKICNHFAPILGVVDFNKSCESELDVPLPVSGIPIYYNRCSKCGFLFTRSFDDWTERNFQEWVYNDDYILVDPDYEKLRPRQNAIRINELLAKSGSCLSLLDYGGGNGLLARRADHAVFGVARTFDPFIPKYSVFPDEQFDVITCFETLEHVPDPRRIVRNISELLRPDGLIIFSTYIQDYEFMRNGLEWWYIGPRNGHISIFSGESLARLWRDAGFTVRSASVFLHAAWRTRPTFVNDQFLEYFRFDPDIYRPGDLSPKSQALSLRDGLSSDMDSGGL